MIKKTLIELTRNIIPKTLEPKVFSGVFKNKQTSELNLVTLSGYSVDDVYTYFEKEIKQVNKDDSVSRYELVLWASDTIPAILENVTEMQIDTEIRNKNTLMKEIIDSKDKTLFERLKHHFTSYEAKLIEEKIK